MDTQKENSSPTETPLAPECSICLEQVIDNGTQAIAKLKCGHSFHMSCIGCEFNIRGIMQCPNCRMIENSDWLFCIGAPADLDYIAQDTNVVMGTADMNQNNENQNQNVNIFQSPHRVRNFLSHQHVGFGSLPVIRPTRAIQVGGNGSNVVFHPNVRIHQHSNLVPILPPPAPQSTPFHASNAAAIGRINRLLNYRPPLILGSNGSVHFHGAFGVHERSLLRPFPPNVARNCILYGRSPQPPPPPPSIQALLAHRGPYWVPHLMPNLVGLEPSVFNQDSSRANRSTDPLEPNLTSIGTSMEQGPFNFDAINPGNVP